MKNFRKEYGHKTDFLPRVLELADVETPSDYKEQLLRISASIDRGKFDKLLNAGQTFHVAQDVEGNYPGLGILLYLSTINVFLEGENKELKGKIQGLGALLKTREIEITDDIREVLDAARNTARREYVGRFIRSELARGLGLGGFYHCSPLLRARVRGLGILFR